MQPLVHLLVAAGYALLGSALCKRMRLPTRGPEGFAWAYGMGSGVASLALMALVAMDAWRPLAHERVLGVLAVALVAVLAAARFHGVRFAASTAPAAPRAPSDPRRRVALTAGIGVAALVLLRATLAGPSIDTGFDALAYHLPAVVRLARDGLGPMVGLLDGEMRLGFDVLFLPGFDLAEPASRGPATIHAVAALALAAGVAGEAARRTSARTGVAAGALFVLSPAVVALAGHAYVDVGVGLYVFLALAAASRALRDGDLVSWVAAGLFAGFAANAKLPAAVAIPAVAVAALVGRGGRRGVKDAALAASVGALVATPWLVRAAIDTGNAFFPAFVDRFGSGWADATVVDATKRAVLDQLPIARDALYGVRALWHGAFARAGGFELPAWILAFAPAALVRATSAPRRGLLAGVAVLLLGWIAFVPSFRFGIGPWAWGAVAAACGAARLAQAARRAPTVLAVVWAGLLGVALLSSMRGADREADVLESPVVRFLRSPDQTLHGPVGTSSSFVVFAPPGAIALEPARNGLLRADEFDDPARLLAACRRVGLRSLVLDERTAEGRKAIACARTWALDPSIRVRVTNSEHPADTLVTVAFPTESAK